MTDNDTPTPEPHPAGTCGAVCHIFEWDSQHAACPPAQRCLCGQVVYGEILSPLWAPGDAS